MILGFGLWAWALGLVVLSFNPRAQATDNLPGDCSDGGRHFARVDLLPTFAALTPEEHHFIARLDFTEICHVHGDHVHRHRADDGRTLTANQDVTAAAQTRIESVGVAGGNHSDGPRRIGLIAPAIANALARPQAFDSNDTARQRHHRR